MDSNYLKGVYALVVALLFMSVPAFASDSDLDSRIESSARESYIFKTFLKDEAIQIKSTQGVVTLTGTVSEKSHKLLAKETVASLPGVIGVDDQLALDDGVPGENPDAWTAIKVKTSLLFHRNVITGL